MACAGQEFAEMFASMDDEVMRARSADIRDITQRLLQNDTLPRAMITASSGQASGVLKALQDEKIPVPERMALACLSDSSTCAILEPPLTALESPSRRLGMVAARMLFDRGQRRRGHRPAGSYFAAQIEDPPELRQYQAHL